MPTPRSTRRRTAAGLLAVAATTLALVTAPAATAAPAPGVVTGTVMGADGNPLRGVTVTLGFLDFTGRFQTLATTTTSAAGRYRLAQQYTDDQYLQFDPAGATGGTSATGYASSCFGGAPWCTAGGAVVKVAAGQTRTIDATLVRAGVLTGRARDSLGRGVGGVAVTYWASGYDQAGDSFIHPVLRATTDANGNYTIAGAAPYRYGSVCFGREYALMQATPNPDGYEGRCDSVGNGDAAVVVTAGRTTVRNTVLAGAGVLTGTVVDATGAPIAGALVTAYSGTPETFPTTLTAANGTFRLATPPGSVAFVVSADRYRDADRTAPVREFTVTRVGRVVLARAS